MKKQETSFMDFLVLALSVVMLFSFLVSAGAQSWTELFPTGTPPTPRHGSGSAYDEVNDRLILFSGDDHTSWWPKPSDVWVLANAMGISGTPSWIQLSPGGGPPNGLTYSTTTYIPNSNRLILHGGCAFHSTPVYAQTWVLTNANGLGGAPQWIHLPVGPRVRWGHVQAHDPDSNRMIVYGGNDGWFWGDYSDVWVLTNADGTDPGTSQWIQLFPTGAPPQPRGLVTSGVYDSGSNRVIIFGGMPTTWQQHGVYNDVWILNNANGLGGTPYWTQVFPLGTPPAPRSYNAMVYDSERNQIIVFGGRDPRGSNIFFNDVWVLTNANGSGGNPEWIQLAPTGDIPAGRTGASVGYSTMSNRMVVAMGRNDHVPTGITPDVWTLNLYPTPQEAIEDLILLTEDMNLQNGINNSLDAKLDAVLKALEDANEKNDVAAINALNAFINAVEAQRGNKISEADADILIAAALDIIAMLNE